MRRFRFDAVDGVPAGRLDAGALKLKAIARTSGQTRVAAMYLGCGGELGRHPAALSQVFLVVHGSGWVSGRSGTRAPISAGEAVVWDADEEHAAGTDEGLVAIVVEGESMDVPSGGR